MQARELDAVDVVGRDQLTVRRAPRNVAIASPSIHVSKPRFAAIRAVFGRHSPALLDSYEHVDGMVIVMAWFRKYPKELKKTLTPEEALAACRV